MKSRCIAIVTLIACGTAYADAPVEQAAAKPVEKRRVPLHENFPWGEIGVIAGLGVGNIVIKTYEVPIAKWRGAPALGDAWGFDKSISNALYQGPFASPFALHVPELVLTEAGPVVYASLYGIDSLAVWLRGSSLSGALNPDHKLMAIAESQFLTAVIALGIKTTVGRERPFEALHRYGSDPGQPKTTMSFFSNQTAASFCFVSFAWRDLGDWLVSGPMAESSDARKLWLGRVLPGTLLFAAGTFDGYSRIVDQRHWFTDVVVGMLVGTGIGYGTYAYHFDWSGQPRRRWGGRSRFTFVPTPSGAAFAGTF